MKRYGLAVAAYRDLEDIHEFISRDSLAYADGMIREIMFAVRRLADAPLIGRERRDISSSSRPLRLWNVSPYVVIYRVMSDRTIRVVRVVHSARDLPTVVRTGQR